MFHYNNEKSKEENIEKILHKAFLKESTDKKLIYKVDFKVIWIYLFGYKISKVITINFNKKYYFVVVLIFFF